MYLADRVLEGRLVEATLYDIARDNYRKVDAEVLREYPNGTVRIRHKSPSRFLDGSTQWLYDTVKLEDIEVL